MFKRFVQIVKILDSADSHRYLFLRYDVEFCKRFQALLDN